MLTRIRIAIGIALAMGLGTFAAVFAKGGFDFITITGSDLKGAVRVADASLTEDFFTFATFYEGKAEAPADPGMGYEITRHYRQGVSDIIFDRLHYYPETGFVFYDGIENGDSEYDDEWYAANPEIKTVFESVLVAARVSGAAAEEKGPVTSAPQLSESIAQAKPIPSRVSVSLPLVIILGAGLLALFAVAFRRRKPTPH